MGPSTTNIHAAYDHLLQHRADNFLPKAYFVSPRFQHLRESRKRQILAFSRQEGERASFEFLKIMYKMSELKISFAPVRVRHGNEIMISEETDFYRSIAIMEDIINNRYLEFRNPNSIAHFYKNRILALGNSGTSSISRFVPRISPHIPNRRTHYENLNFIDD